MLKIGDFSKLCHVGSKTLRYYDDIGLLKAAHVDRFTGYRYYSVEQLPRLNRIVALKELGFSLDQIAQLLQDHVSAEQIEGMLRLKQAEIERHIETEQQRLLRVQARLQQIIHEDRQPTYDVVTKQLEPSCVATIRETIPDYSHVGHLFGALFAHLGTQGITAHGAPFVFYHDGEYREHEPDVEAGIVVESEGVDGERVRVGTLPRMTVASTIHSGPYETLSAAYGALLTWIAINGYEVSAANRDIFLRGPRTDRTPQDYITEVQFPIKKQATP